MSAQGNGQGFWLMIGSVTMAIAVGLGAFGAHGLERVIHDWYPETAEKKLANWSTAVYYQLVHGIGLLIAAMLMGQTVGMGQTTGVGKAKPRKKLATAAICFVAGCFLFSGGLYCWVLTGQLLFVRVIPLGGLSFVAGWCFLALAGTHWTSNGK